jgi:hypothetical protein
MSDPSFDVVEPEGLGFRIKDRANGRLYRVTPARDPRQPRLWCVLIYRCSPGGLADAAERPWLGEGGMAREDLVAALAAIRTDVDGWLGREECRELRRWLLAAGPGDAAPALAARGVASRSRPASAPPLSGTELQATSAAD